MATRVSQKEGDDHLVNIFCVLGVISNNTVVKVTLSLLCRSIN